MGSDWEYTIIKTVLFPVKAIRTPHPKTEDDPRTISPEDQRASRYGGIDTVDHYPAKDGIEPGINR